MRDKLVHHVPRLDRDSDRHATKLHHERNEIYKLVMSFVPRATRARALTFKFEAKRIDDVPSPCHISVVHIFLRGFPHELGAQAGDADRARSPHVHRCCGTI